MENQSEQEIIYGRHPVMEALRSERPITRLFVLAGATGVSRDLFVTARERAIPVVHTDRSRLDALTNRANHQGIVAIASARDFTDIQELLERPLFDERHAAPFFLVLDEVQDPGNFGALLRTAEGAGVHGVIVPGASSCGFTAAVTRASAGADQYMAVSRVAKLGPTLKMFVENGYNVVGADMGGEDVFTSVDFTKPTVVVMGAEGKGLRPSLKNLCTHLVGIPLLGKVQSLNVSAAGAVMLYEVVRQRAGQKSSSAT